jgi:hypothetical protein
MSDTINIYYAANRKFEGHLLNDLLFLKPENLLKSLQKNINKENKKEEGLQYLLCPAFTDKAKNTFVFKFPLSCSYEYKKDKSLSVTSDIYLDAVIDRAQCITDGPIISFALGNIFFAEESVKAYFTSPYFSKSKHTKYGSIMPGNFDIGEWFRPFIAEFQMWSPEGEFHFEENEPLYYVEFATNKKINFIQFEMTDLLHEYSSSLVASTGLFGKRQSLVSRYNRFKNANMREKILKEIKNNIL